MPEDMPRERRMEITGESMNSSEITATFSAIDLTDVYDFLEKSFMLTDIVDLPEDVEIQKDKRVSSAKEILKQGIEGKNSHDAWRDEIFDYLKIRFVDNLIYRQYSKPNDIEKVLFENYPHRLPLTQGES